MKTSEKKTAQKVEKILRKALVNEANSTSCAWVYQPNEPKEIEKFKKFNSKEPNKTSSRNLIFRILITFHF